MAFPFEVETYKMQATAEPKEYGIDFSTGELTGDIVKGEEAVKVWIWLALNTPRYRHVIYSWDWGSEFEDLIGKGYSREHIEIEAQRMAEDALSTVPYVLGTKDVITDIQGDVLTCKVTAITSIGEVIIDV